MSNDRLFFPYEEGDDLFDLYEERLFEDKQFFLNKSILPSVFNRRLQKMEQREIAYRNLTETQSGTYLSEDSSWRETLDFEENFKQYHELKAIALRSIFQCETIPDLIKTVRGMVETFEKYTQAWKLEDHHSLEGVLLSKETEPVLLQQSVKSFVAVGGKQIKQIESLTFEGKEIILNEAKRLSLWRKKEWNNGEL